MAKPFNGGHARGAQRAAVAKQRFLEFYRVGQYGKALAFLQTHMKRGGNSAGACSDAAVCCVHMERWDDAIAYAKRSLALDPKARAALDALAHAYGAKRQWAEAREYGLRALEIRDRSTAELAPVALPLAESGGSRQLIAFALFGGDSKYCESAILNCMEQPAIYPDWTCRFYIDESVPPSIRERIEQAGGETVLVDEEAARWPGPMWRFLAYDEPDVSRVIFRDADSVISEREAGAVREWMDSGLGFHAMRDTGSHTELLLAGLWGVKRGRLPRMRDMIRHYVSKPVGSQRFADQYFLRAYVWPCTRADLLQHDSVFGFGNCRPFPEGPHRADFHVGYAEGSPRFSAQTDIEDGAHVEWRLFDHTGAQPVLVCAYPAVVAAGKVEANLPARYARQLASGGMRVRIERLPEP